MRRTCQGGAGWSDDLRRSFTLTRGNRWHSLGLVFSAGLAAGAVFAPFFIAFRHTDTTVLTFLGGVAAQVVVRSFEALATGLLYFDLVVRSRVREAPSQPSGHRLDHTSWTDESRPAEWYVDPALPSQMRWWPADGSGTWSTHTTKTPQGILDEWKDYAAGRAREGLDRGAPDRSSSPAIAEVEPKGHPLDPLSRSNEDRPAGWYVEVDAPWRMRYWAADGKCAWSERTSKTPKQTLAEWRDPRWARQNSEREG